MLLLRLLPSLLCTLLACFVLRAPVQAADDLRQLVSTDFNSTIAHGLWLVEFFSPACPHCRKFEPTWRKLTEKYNPTEKTINFYMAQVNCLAQGDLCEANRIAHYPEMKLFVEGAELETYKDERTYDDIIKYIGVKVEEYAKNHTVVEDEDEDITEWEGVPSNSEINVDGKLLSLNQKVFPAKMKEGPMFVKFFAPWCGHCKQLAPVWAELASRLKGAVNVAEVNCDENSALCRNMNVQGYPTLILFNAGHKVDYKGSRKLGAMEAFAKKSSSTGMRRVSKETFEKMSEVEKVFFVYLYTKTTSDSFLVRMREASQPLLGDPPFIRSKDPKLWTHLDQPTSESAVLVVVKHGEVSGVVSITSSTTTSSLKEWILQHRYPLADQLSSENFQTVMRSDGGSLVVLTALDTDVSAEVHAANQASLLQIARRWHESGKKVRGKDVAFVWMDGKKWGSWLKSMYGVQEADLPAVIVADHERLVYWDIDVSRRPIAFTVPSIHASLIGIDNGAIYSKSSENVVERAMRTVHNKMLFVESFMRERPFQAVGLVAVILSLLVIGFWKLLQWDNSPAKHDRLD